MIFGIFSYAWTRAQSVSLRLWTSIVFDSPLAQAVISKFICPLFEPSLLVAYGFLRGILGPWCQLRLPRRLVSFVRNYYLPVMCSVLCRIPLISSAILELLVTITLGLTKSTVHYASVRLFLCLTKEQAIRFGSGSFYNSENCFFSMALASGPVGKQVSQTFARTKTSQADLLSSIKNLQISQTLLYLCILGYHDRLFRPCMQSGMLPGATYYTTSTAHLSGRSSEIHIVCHPHWISVVLSPRFEDWFKYLILGDACELVAVAQSRTATNITTATVRKDFYSIMLRLGNSRLENLDQEHGSRKKSEHQTFPLGESVTVFQFIKFLSRKGQKLYITGHSFGGALAVLLAFHLRRAYHVNVTAVVAFGAPPVGNEAFCDLYASQIKVTWSFVNGVELGPLMPPLPFMNPGPDTLWTVGQQVDAIGVSRGNDLPSASELRRDRGRQCSQEEIDEIAETEQLPLVFLNHNPFETLLYVHEALTKLSDQRSSEMIQNQDILFERSEDDFSDSDSEIFYSASSTPLS